MVRYAITSRGIFMGNEFERQAALIERCSRLGGEGVHWLQLREKDLPAGELIELGRRLRVVLRSDGNARTPGLVVNGPVELALSIGADGVHLTSAPDQPEPAEVVNRFQEAGRGVPFVSVSCHTLSEVERARGASAILFGPVFEKAVNGVQVQDGTGLELLGEACRVAGQVPVLALGGVTEENATACVAAGAAGIAGIRLFFDKP